jgi:glycosyltransferase involved in cell wall biosynthesis
MYRERTVGVVVPAYDEAGLVGDVLDAMPGYVDRVYAVDDGSTDATWRELRAAGEAPESQTLPEPLRRAVDDGPLSPRVERVERRGRTVALRHAANRGAGGAVKSGYLAALADGVDLVATVDADGQMDPGRLDAFFDPLVDGDAAYAKGSRLSSVGDARGMPPLRLVGNAALTLLARAATGYADVSDPVNGYTAVTREALARIGVPDLYEGYGYGVDVLARLHAAGAAVVDVPVRSRYGEETSSIRYRTYVPRVSGLLAANALRRLRAGDARGRR